MASVPRIEYRADPWAECLFRNVCRRENSGCYRALSTLDGRGFRNAGRTARRPSLAGRRRLYNCGHRHVRRDAYRQNLRLHLRPLPTSHPLARARRRAPSRSAGHCGNCPGDRAMRRYFWLHNIGSTTEGGPFLRPQTRRIDGVRLMALASANDVGTFLLMDGYRAIVEHERPIGAAGEGKYWTGRSFILVNRILPARPLRR